MADHDKHDDEHGHGGGGHGHGGGHGGGGSHEEHEGAPEWLISFADNVTLMMGFFVILLALNMNKPSGGGGPSSAEGDGKPTPSAEDIDFAIAIREAFNNPVRLDSNNPNDQLLVQRLAQRRAIDENGNGAGDKERDGRAITPRDDRGLEETLSFDDNSAALSDDDQGALDRAAQKLRGTRFVIEVRGHCSAAEAYGQNDRGMRLSWDRASAVAEALDKRGVPWSRLRVIANADNERVTAVAYDAAAQRTNQRVQIISTDRVVQDFEDQSGQGQ